MTAIASLVAPRRVSVRYVLSSAARRGVQSGVRVAIRLAFVAVALVAIAPVVVVALGYQPTFVRTGGSQPTIDAGDVVVNEVVAQSAVQVGDIVTYTNSATAAGVTERVLEVHQEADAYSFTTNSTSAETPPWSPAVNDEVTRVAFRLPALDNAIDEATSPAARDAVVPAGVAILFLFLLQRGWVAFRSRRAQARYW